MDNDLEPSWTIVKFQEDSAVAAVPTNWIITDKECKWPSFLPAKLKAAIKKNQRFEEEWPTYEVKVFRKSTYDSYEVAVTKEIKAVYTSDLQTTDAETEKTKRKLLKKKKFSSASSSSDSEVESHPYRKILPPAPKLRTNKKIDPAMNNNGETSIPTSSKSANAVADKLASNNINESRKLINAKECCCCPMHGEQNRELLRQIYYIRGVINEICNDMKELKLPKATNDDESNTESIFKKFSFPLNSEEELDNFNLYLKEAENFSAAVAEISKIGGNSTYDHVRRSLGKLISNELAVKFSWLGRRAKKSFCSLEVANLTLRAVEKGRKEINTKEIEEAVQNWLRRAAERMKNENKEKV